MWISEQTRVIPSFSLKTSFLILGLFLISSTTLEIDCDKDGNTENARLNTVAYNSAFQTFMNLQSEFTDIVSNCIGMDRTILV